ncbi:MAG: RpiB/LacA/LacB family sugar-phosphate isomerase [Candidatus Levyibacteriota bacterium]
MQIFLANDHTGVEYKNEVKNFLQQKGYEVEDCGAYTFDKDDDYPDFISKAAQGVSKNPGAVGFIFGGSGQGEQMVANKFKGVRCALFYSPAKATDSIDISGNTSDDPFEIIKLTRIHNNANMLSFGVRFLSKETVLTAIDIFLTTEFSKEERHLRRVDKIAKLEEE